MVEAVRTTASPAAIWTICAVAVICLALWLIAIYYADSHPDVRQRRPPEMPKAGQRGAAVADAPAEPIPAQRGAPADTEAANRAGTGRSGRG